LLSLVNGNSYKMIAAEQKITIATVKILFEKDIPETAGTFTNRSTGKGIKK